MRRLALTIALLAGCAATPDRVVVLESDGYMCGAQDGLGCGLAVAPALERIDALEGVARSEVSWDGRTFRIELAPGADATRVTAAASEVLGAEASCDVRAMDAAGTPPARWLDASQVVELSMHEADVIARRFTAEIGDAVELDEADTRSLEAALRAELELAFTNAHDAGGGVPRLWDELPAARTRFAARIDGFLTPEQCAEVGAYLDRELGA